MKYESLTTGVNGLARANAMHTRSLFFEDPDQVVIDIKYFGTFFFRGKDPGSNKLFHILAHGGARSFAEHIADNFWPAKCPFY